MQEELLLEGGLAGHMSHLYENPKLKFSDIKKIFRKAGVGELEGTEKTDGQNLFISYDLASGEARAARNKGNIAKGGMNATELAQKFGGRGSLEIAFTEAFSAFEKAVQILSDKEILDLFGESADIFYNAEIQDPRNPNVIQYSIPTLNIHRVGHVKVEDGKPVAIDDVSSSLVAKLENAIEKIKEKDVLDNFRIQVNAIRRLESLDNEDIANEFINRLESLISDAGLSDSSTVGDYLTLKIVPMIVEDFPLIPEEKLTLLMKRLFEGTSVKLNDIKEGLPREAQQQVSAASKKLGKYFKEAVKPLEMIIHQFAVEILKNFQSAFVLDNKEEVQRLQKEVSDAIFAIRSSGVEEAIEILNTQLEKLVDAEGVSTAAEGFVFDYDGKTYKFTGNFAPANQLLGLFKYGRGKIPALQNLLKEAKENKKLVLLPGGFKPPTKAHKAMIDYYASLPDVEKILVLIGPKPREGFSREQSMKAFDLYNLDGKAEVLETDYNSPIMAAYEFLINDERREAYKDLAFTMGAGSKDTDARRIEEFKNYFEVKNPDKLPEGFSVDVISPCETQPCVGPDATPVSATKLRNAISSRDKEAIKTMIPDNIDVDRFLEIYDTERLEEASSMAAGNVAGHSGRPFKKDDNKKKKELKKLINKGIKTVKEQKRIQEAKFRQIVQALIAKKYKTLLEQEEMKAGERSTAINYLEKVLKMIIPGKVGGSQLEPEYSALSTAAERRSFIKHVIQGLYDEIAPDISLDGLISRFEGRKESFSKKTEQPLMEQEDIKITLDADGLPKSDKQMEDEELESLNSDSLTTGRVTDLGPEDDFPEPISGENSIGRKAAYRFISTQKATIENALKDLQMTPEELEVFKDENPDKEEPQVEFLDFLFTNIALHFDRLENKYFNSEISISEDFFQNVLSQASGAKEAGAEIATASDDINLTDSEEGGEEEVELELGEEGEDQELDLDLGEEEGGEEEGGEEELELEL